MPIYNYECASCGAVERMLSSENRDNQKCDCGEALKRKYYFEGSVWSPTRNGGMS